MAGFNIGSAMMAKVFLGGTCNDSKWRDKLIPLLQIDYFNPIVDDWNYEVQQRELLERRESDFVLYVITPKMRGGYAIAEAVDDSNKKPHKTLFCILPEDEGNYLKEHQRKSLVAVARLVRENGGKIFESLESIADFLNKFSDND